MTDKNNKDDFPKYFIPIFIIGIIFCWIIQPIYFFTTASTQEIAEWVVSTIIGGVILIYLMHKCK